MPQKQNLLFILSDDQGYWAMGCAGNPEISTPNMDRLAETGLRFENFFCTSPVCSPARASILTGRIPSQHGVQDFIRAGNSNIISSFTGKVDNGIEYLKGQTAYTDILAGQRYECGLSGKWHLGYSEKPQKSFRFWDVHATGSGPYYNAPMIRDGELYENPKYVTDLITDNAIGFLESQKSSDEPFSLNVHFTAPHAPWGREHHPSELYDEYFNNCAFDSIPDPPMHPDHLHKSGAAGSLGFTPETRREALSGYFAAVTAMDTNIGRLLDWLEANGLRESTLVVFTSDNGMNMGHHGIYGKGNGTFPPNMFDTAVKVPLLMSQPGHLGSGHATESLHSHYDIMPTLLDYMKINDARADTLPGRSFAGLLRGEEEGGDEHICVFDEYGPTRMIRSNTWKYIHRYPYGPHELYDMANDPDETTNLIEESQHRSLRMDLQAELESWFARYADPKCDGLREAVTGRGQIGIAGVAARGRKRFEDDVVYHAEVLKEKDLK